MDNSHLATDNLLPSQKATDIANLGKQIQSLSDKFEAIPRLETNLQKHQKRLRSTYKSVNRLDADVSEMKSLAGKCAVGAKVSAYIGLPVVGVFVGYVCWLGSVLFGMQKDVYSRVIADFYTGPAGFAFVQSSDSELIKCLTIAIVDVKLMFIHTFQSPYAPKPPVGEGQNADPEIPVQSPEEIQRFISTFENKLQSQLSVGAKKSTLPVPYRSIPGTFYSLEKVDSNLIQAMASEFVVSNTVALSPALQQLVNFTEDDVLRQLAFTNITPCGPCPAGVPCFTTSYNYASKLTPIPENSLVSGN